MSEKSLCWSLAYPIPAVFRLGTCGPHAFSGCGWKLFICLKTVIKSLSFRLNPSNPLTFWKRYFKNLNSSLQLSPELFSDCTGRQMWPSQLCLVLERQHVCREFHFTKCLIVSSPCGDGKLRRQVMCLRPCGQLRGTAGSRPQALILFQVRALIMSLPTWKWPLTALFILVLFFRKLFIET